MVRIGRIVRPLPSASLHVDEEHRQALGALLATWSTRRGARQQQHQVGVLGAGGPDLLAVDDVVVAVASARVCSCSVSVPVVGSVTPKACSRSSPRGDLRQILALLLVAAVPQQRAHVYICAWQAPALQPDAWISSRIARGGAQRQAGAAVLLGDQRREPAGLGQRLRRTPSGSRLGLELAPVLAGKVRRCAHALADLGIVLLRPAPAPSCGNGFGGHSGLVHREPRQPAGSAASRRCVRRARRGCPERRGPRRTRSAIRQSASNCRARIAGGRAPVSGCASMSPMPCTGARMPRTEAGHPVERRRMRIVASISAYNAAWCSTRSGFVAKRGRRAIRRGRARRRGAGTARRSRRRPRGCRCASRRRGMGRCRWRPSPAWAAPRLTPGSSRRGKPMSPRSRTAKRRRCRRGPCRGAQQHREYADYRRHARPHVNDRGSDTHGGRPGSPVVLMMSPNACIRGS